MLNLPLVLVLVLASTVRTSSSTSFVVAPPSPVRRVVDVGLTQHSREAAAAALVPRSPSCLFGAAASSSSSDVGGDVPWFVPQAEDMMRSAAIEAGADPDQIAVDWGAGRVTVTIGGDNARLSAYSEEGDDEEDLLIEDFVGDGRDGGEDFISDDSDDEDSDGVGDFDVDPGGPDITAIARAINHALEYGDDGEGADSSSSSVGWNVASRYEIEVTTPGSSDVLTTPEMFDAYRGFDVIVETLEAPKKKKKKKKKSEAEDGGDGDGGSQQPATEKERKVVEGKLVERDDEVTVINIKGRMKRIKNDAVTAVRLPKAKREKGAAR